MFSAEGGEFFDCLGIYMHNYNYIAMRFFRVTKINEKLCGFCQISKLWVFSKKSEKFDFFENFDFFEKNPENAGNFQKSDFLKWKSITFLKP